MQKIGAVWISILTGLSLAGCATTSVNQTVEGIGPVGDRVLVKRQKTTVTSSPWTGAALKVEQPEFFLCGAAGENRVECEAVQVDLPAPASAEQGRREAEPAQQPPPPTAMPAKPVPRPRSP